VRRPLHDSEFRYGGRPIEPLQTLDESGRVLYVGSFSKTMLATLRLGFVVVPEPLVSAVRAAEFVEDWHTSLPIQAALAGFIDQGYLARHIRRMRLGRGHAEPARLRPRLRRHRYRPDRGGAGPAAALLRRLTRSPGF
jgi:DNA-binding transcriptional MocR family regulator